MVFLRFFLIFLCAALPLAPAPAAAATDAMAASMSTASLLDMKFTYINKFTGYVTWPPKTFESDTSPFRACIIGDAAVSEAFQAYAKKIVNTHPILAVRISSAADADKCHFLYIAESSDSALARKALKAVEKNPVLTIGDSPDFMTYGGMIRFIFSDRKLSFEINPAAAKRSNLIISSKLLGLAKITPSSP